jgi:hypothetical protein
MRHILDAIDDRTGASRGTLDARCADLQRFLSALIRCFPGLESRKNQQLDPDPSSRVRARYESILWIILLFLDHLQRITARFPAVISLFQCSRIEEFCGFRRSPGCFSLE